MGVLGEHNDVTFITTILVFSIVSFMMLLMQKF